MSKRVTLRDEQILAESLRREAEQSRPEFSETLHAQICRAVRECPREDAPAGWRRPLVLARWRARRHIGVSWPRAAAWACVAVAAASLAGVAIVAWPRNEVLRGPHTSANAQVGLSAGSSDPGLDLHSFGGVTTGVSGTLRELVDSAAETQRWAYLDGDARLAVEMLAARLPFDVAAALASNEKE
jgi:hypothetical protein